MSDTTARLESDNPSIVGQFGACKAGDKVTLTVTGEITEHATDKSSYSEPAVDSVMRQKSGPRHHLRLKMKVASLEYAKHGAAKKRQAPSPGVERILNEARGY